MENDHITIQTKKRQKKIEFRGTFVSTDRCIYINNSNAEVFDQVFDWITIFIANLQKNQTLELFINSEKIGNIKNLLLDDNTLMFEAPFLASAQVQAKIVDTISRTSLQIFRDEWQRFDKNIDLHSVLRSVFQIDPRMSFSFNMKSDEERKEILNFAAELIFSKIKEL